MAQQNKLSITKADGSEVTAQEVYDAVMAGPCFIDVGEGLGLVMITEIIWLDSSGAMGDSTDVVFCIVQNAAANVTASVGTEPTTSK